MPKKTTTPPAADMFKQVFEPFSWLNDPHKLDNVFLETTHDIARGIATVLSLVVTSTIDDGARADGDNRLPILGRSERETLMLFATASAKLLGEHADHEIERLNQKARAKS